MSQIALSSNASGTGTLTIASPNTNSNRTIDLPDASTTLVGTDATQTLTNKTLTSPTLNSPTINTPTMGGSVLTSDTVKNSTSGTNVDFTGIPSWVKRITVMFNGISTNGTSNIQIQLGDSGGFETSGYLGSAWTANTVNTLHSSGFLISGSNSAAIILHGSAIITLVGSNAWAMQCIVGRSDAATANISGGAKTLSDTLTQVRITTVNGTDTFDAGSINIMYE